MRGLPGITRWLLSNWERVLFASLGLIFLTASIDLVLFEKITESAILFGLGLLSFIYANVAKFKRFKGFGIEAELWEDKQKEAADLIQQLRGLVATYSNELLMSKVKAGRWGPTNEWANRWKLYDELVGQHQQLGQKIDFSSTKKEMDDYFIFDMVMPEIHKLNQFMQSQMASVSNKINQEFGSPIVDTQGFQKRVYQMNDIWRQLDDPFQTAKTGNLAELYLNKLTEAQTKLKNDFDVELGIGDELTGTLKEISAIYTARPVVVTERLIRLANHE